MAAIQIAIINESSILTDQQVRAVIPALQTQVHRDFAPIWGIDADLTFVPTGSQPAVDSWWLAILDNSDQAGALGYHDLTSQGLPMAKVFAADDMQAGYQWTITTSHELLEMLADPDVNLTAFIQTTSQTAGELYAYEVCDACEADNYGYTINGTPVSDFVYPSWFESFWPPNGTKFDYSSSLTQPFELLPGGYIGVFKVEAGSGWQQLTADTHPHKHHHIRQTRHGHGSRPDRRNKSRDLWQASTLRTLEKR